MTDLHPFLQSPKERSFTPPVEFSNLVELLQYRARHQAEKRAYTFLLDGETEQAHLTYRQLDHQAQSVAARLQSIDAAGERVLLFYPPGLDFMEAFMGCLYAGAIATPAYPPRLNRSVSQLQAIIADAQATVALTTAQILAKLESRLAHVPQLAGLRWIATDQLDENEGQAWQPVTPHNQNVAYLQYTSGSTSAPKGVKISHRNLWHTLSDLDLGLNHTSDSKMITWLPHFHDMGLIYGLLQPLYGGFPGYVMSPMAFIQSPFNWLQALTRYQGTHSAAPNFAYELCLSKVTAEQRAALDLSSWRVALNGAEPIRAETLKDFYQTFKDCGFRWETFCPGYGLAEASLKVTALPQASPPVFCPVQPSALEQNKVIKETENEETAQVLVGCGRPMLDTQIVIVHPETLTRCRPDEVGEIWVSSSSVAAGYWGRPAETDRVFQARLADSGEGPFLRTGDLGFMQEGELFITGRLKDLIIIRGRNYYPQDLELAAEQSHSALRPDCGAAFSVEIDNQERLVIVYELKREARQPDISQIIRTVQQAVAETYELPVYAVVLVKTGTIPRTSSGKIQRRRCRAQFLADDLEVVGADFQTKVDFKASLELPPHTAPRSPMEETIAKIWADVLGREPVGIYDNFFALGGHSLLATQIISRLRQMFQIELSLQTLFEQPTVADLAQSIEAARQPESEVQLPPLDSAPRTQALPLSFAQERMWFLDQLQAASAAYHIPLSFRLSGPMKVEALERSLNEIGRRHEALRTVFTRQAGRLEQKIVPQISLTVPVIDLRGLPQFERHVEARRLSTQHIQEPFDLGQGPLIRVTLFRLGLEEHVLLIVMHHIIADAWSFSVLWQELTALYKSFVTGESASLPPLPVQYADFAHWQRQWLRGQRLETEMRYWKQRLAGAPAVLNLPTDRPRPPVQTFAGASQTFSLDDSLLDALREWSRVQGTTLFMTMLAAFKLLLYRYTGQTDILVGTPIANRHWLAVERLIGVFVNTLVIRTDLSGNPPFKELLAQMRQTTLEAYAHQDLPFEQLIAELHPNRDLSHSPVVQVLFSMANPPLPWLELPDLSWELFETDRGAAQFDLTFSMVDTAQIKWFLVEYNTDLFDHATISRMLNHYNLLLQEIVATNGQQRLLQLPLLTSTERDQLLETWNATGAAYPRDLCLHQLISTQADHTPEAEALGFENESLTYRQLNRRANRLAHYLKTLGVGPEVSVGLCLDRSLEMLVGLLGILKAGGVYVPLDPNFPPSRLAFMLNDLQAQVLVTQQHLVDSLSPTQAHLVCLDRDEAVISRQSPENPCSPVSPQNLAYIIYTSGSTGQPKGVEIPHRAVVNFLHAMSRRPGITPQDRLLAVTTLSFDIAGLELFLPLMVGARIELVSSQLARDGHRLAQKIKDSQATLMQATPATWQLLLDSGWQGSDRLKILCGGEALPRDLANQLLEKSASLWNMYGPTETTIWSTCLKVEPGQGPVPLGRPIDNTQIYILDSQLQPTPVGVPGDLYIGGDGLARGYHNRPKLAAEKFIPHPFSNRPGARLYKTGDLARYLSDGNLEFLGRLDSQVKIRGFRIELGEIEAALRHHKQVRQAVALVREDTPGDKRLVAYFVAGQENNLSASELRRFVQNKLPDYMVPAIFIALDSLPLTPNDKIDRLALPAPQGLRPRSAASFVAPQTMVEERLAEIWTQILGLDRVGIYDNFFELGGHSLLATQLMFQVESAFQVKLPLPSFFDAPTIAESAALIEEKLIAEIDRLTEEEAQRLAEEFD